MVGQEVRSCGVWWIKGGGHANPNKQLDVVCLVGKKDFSERKLEAGSGTPVKGQSSGSILEPRPKPDVTAGEDLPTSTANR